VKLSLLEYLACPSCLGPLELASSREEGAEVIEGELRCGACSRDYPVRGGVPRFVSGAETKESERTASAFGWEWQVFAGIEDRYEQQFLDWIAPVSSDMFDGRVVLEGGCGKGRHTRLAARYGARAVIGLDLSDAVDVAFANTREEPNAHIVQADLLHPPLRAGTCDYAFSVGVIHHLPEPEAGFRSLVRAVRPGGGVSVWVYGAENNAWVSRVVSPLRVALTSRLPPRVLYWLSMAVALPLWLALVTLYRPARRPGLAWLRRILFYYPYMSYISRFPFREIHHIVHDHLAAPIAHYLRREEVERWYREASAVDTVVAWHNRNSWRGYGIMRSDAGSDGGEAGPGHMRGGAGQ
jgi:SAM-dependent methyltransferase